MKSRRLPTFNLCHLIFLGHVNADIKNCCNSYNLTSMVNKATSYKNPHKPTCIDLILTNCPGPFQNPCVVETGLSYFHKMVVRVMKTSQRKSQPKYITVITKILLTIFLGIRYRKSSRKIWETSELDAFWYPAIRF